MVPKFKMVPSLLMVPKFSTVPVIMRVTPELIWRISPGLITRFVMLVSESITVVAASASSVEKAADKLKKAKTRRNFLIKNSFRQPYLDKNHPNLFNNFIFEYTNPISTLAETETNSGN